MDPYNNIFTPTLTIFQATSSAYRAIQHFRGLPDEFKKVDRSLVLAQNTLDLVSSQLQSQTLDESSRNAIQKIVSPCEEKATALHEIFEEIEQSGQNGRGGSVLELYRTSLLRLGKASRVEILMQGILEDLDALAVNRVFRTATQSQLAKLEAAIEEMSKVKSSVSDSELTSAGTSNNQHIATGATGHQYNAARDINFVQPSDHDRKVRADILRALDTSKYLAGKNRNPDRVPKTCEWFLNHDHFKEWRQSTFRSMLWVSANPGCGKSVLAKYLVDELKTTNSRTTCYFFFKDDVEDQKSAKHALCCILRQIFVQREDLFTDSIVKRFETSQAYLTNSLDELWDVLLMVSRLASPGEIVCILDAFDECEEKERQDLAKILRKFYEIGNDTNNNSKLKFLITSRPYKSIGQSFQPLNISGLPVIHLKGEGLSESESIAQEIDIYIQHRVAQLRPILELEIDEEEMLLKELRRVPNQTYLWVYLTLAELEKASKNSDITKAKILELMSSLPPTVNVAYNRILNKSSDVKTAKRLLHIIVAAARPLTVSEMGFALDIRQEHTCYADLDLASENRIRTRITNLCGLFVNITESKNVYLLHQTAKEFLVQKEVDEDTTPAVAGEELSWESSLRPQDSHGVLYEICAWNLLFTDFDTINFSREGPSDLVISHVFLAYSAANWALHFRESGIKDKAVMESLNKICDPLSNRRIIWFDVYWMLTHPGTTAPFFPTLMMASFFGLEQFVLYLIANEAVDLYREDDIHWRSALSWASENGFDGVVNALIQATGFFGSSFSDFIKSPSFSSNSQPFFTRVGRLFFGDMQIDAQDIYGRTPLSYAAQGGHLAIVKRLIEAGAQADSEDKIGGTPISYALCTGRDEIARQLLKGKEIESVDRIRKKLLLSASNGGYIHTVKMMLENNTPVDARGFNRSTPLYLAATAGHSDIVALLLEHGADVNAKCKKKNAPLHRAALRGDMDTMEVLLQNGATVDIRDGDGYTPLSNAAQYGHSHLITLLLSHGADVNTRSAIGQTPLDLAAGSIHTTKAVQILLEKGAHVNPRDDWLQTPLHSASNIGNSAVVRLLLLYNADVDARDEHGRTPLTLAAMEGHHSITSMLLAHSVTVDAKDDQNRTPLWYAKEKRCATTVRLLLENGADVRLGDDGDSIRIETLTASANGIEEVVKLLVGIHIHIDHWYQERWGSSERKVTIDD